MITIDGTISGWMSIDCLNEPKKGKLKIIIYRFHYRQENVNICFFYTNGYF